MANNGDFQGLDDLQGRVDAYLEEVITVSRKHGLSLSRGFSPFSEDLAHWLAGAEIEDNLRWPCHGEDSKPRPLWLFE